MPNSPRILFEAFFYIIGIFGRFQPLNESTFPFQYIVIFLTYQSLEPPSTTLGGDRHMRPLTCFVGN